MILRQYACFLCFHYLFHPSSFQVISLLFPLPFIPYLFSFSFFNFLLSILYSQLFSFSVFPFSSLLFSHLLSFIFIFHYIILAFICIFTPFSISTFFFLFIFLHLLNFSINLFFPNRLFRLGFFLS